MARVLVTGATGFVGGRLATRLRCDGVEVVAPVRRLDDGLASLGVDQRRVELTAIDVPLVREVDAVVHAAAATGPDLETARQVNRDGTRHLVATMLRAGSPRFVHVSTTSVYDLAAVGDTEVHEDAPLVAEGADASPASSSGSAYAVSKAEAESEAAGYLASGGSVAILRPPAVLGAGPTSTWGTRIPRRLLAGEGWPRHPATSFAWVHVDDLVDAIVAALDTDVDRTLNVVGGHATVSTYLDAVADLLPGQVTIETGDGTPWRGRYATQALVDHLGVRPSRTFEDAMTEIAASWRGPSGPGGTSTGA